MSSGLTQAVYLLYSTIKPGNRGKNLSVMKQKMRYVNLFVPQNLKMRHIGRVRLSVKNLIFQQTASA